MQQTSSVKKAARKARSDAFSPGNLESQGHRTPLGVAAPRGAGQASSSLQCSVCSSALAARAGSAEHRDAPAALALGNVVAGVGGNLIAEQIQRWHDQAHLPSEADVATWITAHITTNADLRQALDTILEHLQVISQAREWPRPTIAHGSCRRYGRNWRR